MGSAGQGRMTTHQHKKLDVDELRAFRDRFALPLSDADVEAAALLQAGRRQPGDALPARAPAGARRFLAASTRHSRCRAAAGGRDRVVRPLRAGSDGKQMSTTMAVVRMLGNLLKDADAGPARGTDRRRRGAHLRHGQPVPPGRHLLAIGADLRARGSRVDALLPRGEDRPDPRGRHLRGRRDQLVDRRGDQLLDARPRRCCRSTSTTRCSAGSVSAI